MVYSGGKPVASTIVVDKEALGFPGRGKETISLDLKANEAGYRVIRVP